MRPTILYFEGEPVQTFSRERLIEALYVCAADLKAEREAHTRTNISLALALAVPKRRIVA